VLGISSARNVQSHVVRLSGTASLPLAASRIIDVIRFAKPQAANQRQLELAEFVANIYA
jgi:hypothetical protein